VSSWKQWQYRPQTKEEFDALHIEKYELFGVVCGAKIKVGDEELYFCAVDRDVKGEDATPETLQKSLEAINSMRTTRREKTRSGGNHLIYYSRQPVNGWKPKGTGLELLGKGNLCIMTPSEGYNRENDNPPSIVENVEEMFLNSLVSANLIERKTPTTTITSAIEIKSEPIRPCFEKLMKQQHLRHIEKVALVYELHFTGKTDDEIRKIFHENKAWEPSPEHNYDQDETDQRLTYTIGKASEGKNFRYKRETLQDQGICFPECAFLNCPDCRKPHEENEHQQKQSQADEIVSICLEQNPVFFHDQHKTPFLRVNQKDANLIMPIRSRQCKTWLANLMWQKEKKAPGTEGLNSALTVLQGKAQMEGKQYILYNRVAPAEDGFWMDMTNEKWQAIKVDANGWRIVDDPPILFRRYSHQLPLVEPVLGGDPWRLLAYFNISKDDNDTRLIVMCVCASYFVSLIPHPILVLHGIQGSGKSWVFKLVRRIFDPSSIEVLTMPRDERERVQQLEHNWLAFYDNITSMPSWISDSLCRAATGGGFTKRELYSDDEDIIFNFKRCVGLNGINIAAQRGDLLDRSVLVGLEHIPNGNRKTEEKLLADFEKEKASILGGFLDVLVKSIQLYPTVNPDRLFRMADFTRWGCAIAKALGKAEEDFMNAYESKVKSQVEEAAHASPVATVLLDYIEKVVAKKENKEWTGSPTDLFKILLDHAKGLEISTRQKGWPKAPHALVRQLNELAPSLKSLGWDIAVSRTGTTRRICINSVTSVTSDAPKEPKGDDKATDDANDGNDAIITSSLGRLQEKDAKTIHGQTLRESKPVFYVKDIPTGEKCDCGKFAVTKEIVIPSGDTIHRCKSCFNELKNTFASANWKQGYPDMANYDGETS
jgi:hypothetical protein